MRTGKAFGALLLVILPVILQAGAASAVDDGFLTAAQIAGTHFTTELEDGVDLLALAEQLDVDVTDTLLAGKRIDARMTAGVEFAAKLDTLFLRVCDILDIHLYSYHGALKICTTNRRLKDVYSRLFGKELAVPQPFYVHDLNTIYASVENCRRAVLGHETAHAVISNYFAVPSPVTVQEVLAGYVEYQLRKGGGSVR